jgi:hypothetical protein
MRVAGRKGISKLAVPLAIGVIVIVAAAGAFVILGHQSTSTSQSTSSGSSSAVPVSTQVDRMVQDLNSRNVDDMMTLYKTSAVDVWSGATGGLSGLYTGSSDIRLIYATTVGKSQSLTANITDYKEKIVSSTQTNATYVVHLVSNSTVAGIVTATIDVSQQWNLGNSGWQITKENWAYAQYDSSYVDAGHASSATTFPQWGYALKGGNPNLVPEKSFEWHAGPYVAASVYALLVGIVAVMALRLLPRERRTFGMDH